MKRSMLLAVVVVVILVVAVGGYLAVSMGKGTTSSTAAPSANGIAVTSDTLVVNANAGTGTWSISVENTGNLTASIVTANIGTSPPLLLCSGNSPSSGLFYKNCPSLAGSPLPPNQTITGSSSGTGAQSATAGNSYAVSVHVQFTNGQSTWVNSTITATSG